MKEEEEEEMEMENEKKEEGGGGDDLSGQKIIIKLSDNYVFIYQQI